MIQDYGNERISNDVFNITRRRNCKKRASHSSSIRETDIGFQKFVDKLELETEKKLEETENLKLQYVLNVQTTNSQIKKSKTPIMN